MGRLRGYGLGHELEGCASDLYVPGLLSAAGEPPNQQPTDRLTY